MPHPPCRKARLRSAPSLFMPTSDAPFSEPVIRTQAMVFIGPNQPMEERAMGIPATPGPNEVIVRIRLATICGSDLHTFTGRRREAMPSILGHEGVGEVVAAGPERTLLRAGDRVTWSLIDHCNTCPACLDWDLPQKCSTLFKYGHARWEERSAPDGCYATHIVLRGGTHVVKLPEAVTDRMAVAANCALATMVHAVEKLRGDERTVWIQGGGLLGLFGAALLQDRGVPRIIVTEPDPRRRALAAELGVTAMPVEEFLARPDLAEGGCDAVIELAGDPSVVVSGTTALRPGGIYLWVGMVHPNTSLAGLTGEQIVRRCTRVQGIYNYAPRHLDRAIEFLTRRGAAFPFDAVISPPLPLARLNEAFALALEWRWLRVSIDCASPVSI